MSTRKGQRQSRIRSSGKARGKRRSRNSRVRFWPQDDQSAHGIAAVSGGMSGEQYVAKAGQILDEKKENGQKKGEISAVTKLQQQERQRRESCFLVFGGLLFLSTALVCILPVRKKGNVSYAWTFSDNCVIMPLEGVKDKE